VLGPGQDDLAVESRVAAARADSPVGNLMEEMAQLRRQMQKLLTKHWQPYGASGLSAMYRRS
jgi:hypothetical protein